jgi:hypothetical protein
MQPFREKRWKLSGFSQKPPKGYWKPTRHLLKGIGNPLGNAPPPKKKGYWKASWKCDWEMPKCQPSAIRRGGSIAQHQSTKCGNFHSFPLKGCISVYVNKNQRYKYKFLKYSQRLLSQLFSITFYHF